MDEPPLTTLFKDIHLSDPPILRDHSDDLFHEFSLLYFRKFCTLNINRTREGLTRYPSVIKVNTQNMSHTCPFPHTFLITFCFHIGTEQNFILGLSAFTDP